ncbi:MAG TPA: CBS domain-containing protein [Streptosporangiaceae bacterium]|nr:CBS domain-containing protein [Streptosporangiaceae bacterium]
MNRRDAHLDAMLRHLGAAYYESLHGRASASDVKRALNTVEDHVAEQGGRRPRGPAAGPAGGPRRGRRHRTVGDVMTTSVVAVDRVTPAKEIASLIAQREVSAVPVLTMGRRVAGVVSETDLLRIEDQRARRARALGDRRVPRWRSRRRPWGVTAGALMTSPAVTIGPDATIHAAARVMSQHHLKQLPVVDPAGVLIGIVSRRDLLSVFLRPDDQIAEDVRAMLTEILFTGPDSVHVVVKDGVVVLTGQPGEPDQPDLIAVAEMLTWDIDGVVDVVNRLTAAQPG